MIFDTDTWMLIGAVLLSGVTVALIAFGIARVIRDRSPDVINQRQFESIMSSDDEDTEVAASARPSVITRWNQYWGRMLHNASPYKFTESDNRAGTLMALVWIGGVLAVTLFFRNILAGLVVSSLLLVCVALVLKITMGKRENQIRDQLTGFLFALKSNLSANALPEQALMNIIDGMPNPLLEELEPLKRNLLASVSFNDALSELRDTTRSIDLQFLASCLIQGNNTGSSLDKQIDIIRETIDERKRINETITQSTRSANIGIYGATIIIPGTLIALYIVDERVREYWFVNPTSWIALILAGGIYSIGIFFARKFVNTVRKL